MLNFKKITTSYTNAFAQVFKAINIDDAIDPFTINSTLSNIYKGFTLLEQHVPLNLIKIDELNVYPSYLETNITQNNSENIINIFTDTTEFMYRDFIKQFASIIYNIILKENSPQLLNNLNNFLINNTDESTSKDISARILFTEKFLITVLNKDAEINDNSLKVILDNLSKYLITKEISLNAYYTNDNKVIDFLLLKNIKPSDKINILNNEEREYLQALLDYNLNISQSMMYTLPYPEKLEISRLSYDNCFINFNINKDDFLNQDVAEIDNSTIITEFEDIIEDLSPTQLYELQEKLSKDLDKLKIQINMKTTEVKFIEGEIIKGTQSDDAALKENLRYVQILSNEQQAKSKLLKLAKSSENSYSKEYIEYSELRESKKTCDNLLKESSLAKTESAIASYHNIEAKINRILGMSYNELESIIKNMDKIYFLKHSSMSNYLEISSTSKTKSDAQSHKNIIFKNDEMLNEALQQKIFELLSKEKSLDKSSKLEDSIKQSNKSDIDPKELF